MQNEINQTGETLVNYEKGLDKAKHGSLPKGKNSLPGSQVFDFSSTNSEVGNKVTLIVMIVVLTGILALGIFAILQTLK